MSGIRRKVSATLPAFFQATGLKPFANDAAYVTAKGSAAATGDAYWNTSDDEIRAYNGAAWVTVVTADASGNVIITGDLQVDGDTTTVNTETLDVEDANITINKNGNQSTADDTAGLTVEMSDATNASVIYDKDATSRWKVGEVGSEVEVADISSSQTLSNKTIDNSNSVTLQDANFTLQDNADNTKLLDFELANISTATTRTITMPDQDITVVGTDATQTLANKTIDADNNTISNLAHGAEVDNPSSGVHGVTGSVVGTSDAQTINNKTIVVASNTVTTAASGNLTSTELNAALSELQTDIDTRVTSTDLSNHTTDTTTHGTTGDIVGTSDTQTLTNKTVDGNNNTLTVLAASQLSGAAPIANGGTGQTTASAAFNALAPTTTKGDLIAYSTTNARLAIGSNGYKLTPDSGETTGLKWRPDSEREIVTKTASYTATASDDIILCDTGSSNINLTLPAASSNTGKVFVIKKIAATNTVSIVLDGADEIDGETEFYLYKDNNFIEIVSDGADWWIINKDLSDYREVSITTRVTTVTADTHLQTTENIALPVGTWEIGYYILQGLDENGGSNRLIVGSVALYDGSSIIADSQAGIREYVLANTSTMHTSANKIEKKLTSTTSIYLDIVCNLSSATGQAILIDEEISGAITGSDNLSRIWARRIA